MPRIFPVGTLALVCLLGALSEARSASCPDVYANVLSATANICNGGELCNASRTSCDPTQGCRVRTVTGALSSTVTASTCPAGSLDFTDAGLGFETLSNGAVKNYCFRVNSPFATLRFKSSAAPQSVNGTTQTTCSRWTMRVTPPATSGLQAQAGTDVTYAEPAGRALPYGAWVVTLTGSTPAAPCGQSRVSIKSTTTAAPADYSSRGAPARMCVAPTRGLNYFRVTTTDRSSDGCGTLQLKVTDQSTGAVRTLDQTGTNTVLIQSASASTPLRGPFLIEVAPGSGPAPSAASPCLGSYLYGLTWTADELPENTQPGPPEVSGQCPAGTQQLTENFQIGDEMWSAGTRLTMGPSETVNLCWLRDSWTAGFDVNGAFVGTWGVDRFRITATPPPGSEDAAQTSSFGSNLNLFFTRRVAPGPALFKVETNASAPAGGRYYLRVEDCAKAAPPGPSVTPRATATPRATINPSCPVGYTPLNQTFRENPGSTPYDGGLRVDNAPVGQTYHFCILPETGTVDDNGAETGVSQHPRGGTSEGMSVRVLGRTASFRSTAKLTYPPSMGSVLDTRYANNGHLFSRHLRHLPNSEPFLLDVTVTAAGDFSITWSAVGGKPSTGVPTPRPGDTYDPILGIPAAPGTNIGNNFSPSSTTTFFSVFRAPVFATLFYYGWDASDTAAISQMSVYPDAYPGITSLNFGYTSTSWIRDQLDAMMAADIDLAIMEYTGWPGTADQNTIANGGLQNVVDVWEDAKNDGYPVPKIGMLLTGETFLYTSRNPFGRVLNLTSEADQKYFVGTVRDFWSQIPSGLWGQLDHRPVIVLGPPGPSRVDASAIARLRRYFKLYFGTKDPYIIADTTSWGSIASSADATTTWFASLNGPSFGSKVAQFGPGFDDSRLVGAKRGVRSRAGGATYDGDWGEVLPRLSDGTIEFVILETWNQYQQGNVIGPGYSFGSQYVDATFGKVSQARSSTPSAAFVSQYLPTFASNQMVVGAKGTAQLTFKNSGSSAWSAASGFYLGSQNPQDNVTWGLNRVSLGEAIVPPGGEHTFSFEITAPATAGARNFQWKMLRESSSWFGEPSTNISITVVSPTPTPIFTATPVPTQTPAPTTTSGPTPTAVPTPVESSEFPPGPIETPFAGCPEGYTTLQPPFGVPGVCYEQGRPDRPLRTPAAGKCPTGYFIDVTPFGSFCRPLPTPTPR